MSTIKKIAVDTALFNGVLYAQGVPLNGNTIMYGAEIGVGHNLLTKNLVNTYVTPNIPIELNGRKFVVILELVE